MCDSATGGTRASGTAGGRLAGVTIPQGQANGYPLYRLEWQDLGSLSRRIRNCMTGVRAQPLPAHSVEMVELELHLATRALGMAVETPAVRP
jgi:sulfur-oxidizing protein SoxA